MRNLHENPEIFTVESGSGTLRLVKPAKLKSVSSRLWEIEEPGIFQANEQNTEPSQQNIKVHVEQVQVLEVNKDTEIYNLNNQENQFIPSKDNVQCYDSILDDSKDINPCIISSQLQEIVERFNQQRPELFDDFPSQLLTLTQDTIGGKLDLSSRRILQLEVPADPSQGTYLKFEMDNASWLIPNITSNRIIIIMSRLTENPEIFAISSGSTSGSLRLIKPAQLKEISSGLWEIEEPGEFQS